MAERDDNDTGDRALYGLLIALVLLAVGWIIVSKLGEASRIQDCVSSGRRNCAPIDPDNLK